VFSKHDLDHKKAHEYTHALTFVVNTFFSKQNMRTHGVCFACLPKSQISPGKAVIIFWDIVFVDQPRKDLLGFQIFEVAAPNYSMAISNEHSSV
jgi:hypothetical protein